MIDTLRDTTVHHEASPTTWSTPKVLLHLEGLALLGTAVAIYAMQGFAWSTFFLLFLVPDLAFLPYMINRQLGTFI